MHRNTHAKIGKISGEGLCPLPRLLRWRREDIAPHSLLLRCPLHPELGSRHCTTSTQLNPVVYDKLNACDKSHSARGLLHEKF